MHQFEVYNAVVRPSTKRPFVNSLLPNSTFKNSVDKIKYSRKDEALSLKQINKTHV